MATHLDKSHVASMLHMPSECEPALDVSQPASNVCYVLVAVGLMQLMRLSETRTLYYSKTQMGDR